MSPEQFEQMNKTIKDTIYVTVNGKIDGLRRELQEYIKSDNDWKGKVQPDIDSVSDVKKFGKIGFGIITFVSIVIGVIYGLIRIIRG